MLCVRMDVQFYTWKTILPLSAVQYSPLLYNDNFQDLLIAGDSDFDFKNKS